MIEALRSAADDFLAALTDVAAMAGDARIFAGRMRELGWEVSGVPPPFQALATAGDRVIDLLSAEELGSERVVSLIEAIGRVVAAIRQLQSSAQPAFPTPAASAEFWSNIARDFLDSLLVDHLSSARPTVASALKLVGLIRETPIAATASRLDYVKREIRWQDVGDLLSDPQKGFSQAFDWSGSPRLQEIITSLAGLIEGTGLEPRIRGLDPDLLAFLNAGAVNPAEAETLAFDLAWEPSLVGGSESDFGVLIHLRPATVTRPAGIALLPYARLSGADDIELSEQLSVSLKGQADFTKGLAVTISPNSPVIFESGFVAGAMTAPMEALVGLNLKPVDGATIVLIGDPEGSHLGVGAVSILAGAKSGNGGKIDALIDVALDNAKLVIKPTEEDADSFLASLLPADGLAATFSLSVRYSSVTGFHLGGSGGLEASFPSRAQLGPVELQAVTLALRPQSGSVDLAAGATIAAKLGPLQAVVENVGLKLVAAFPGAQDGNFGPVDLGLAFKPPSGVGLSLDLAAIKGGGYLFFDPAKGEYAGALEFTLADFVSVKAFGLVNTKMPDGSRGFSLLVILSAEFNPGLQLSFGFTLVGVGGLVGLNRAMRFEPLLEGVRTGAVANIMFPKDVVANAPRILSDLRAIFPPQPGTFLVGPMLKIGWGTPTLMSVSMGVIIEIPGNIALLGVLQLALPDEDAAIIRIKVAFAGGIDFEGKRIFFVAALYDSRVLTMTLEGGTGFYIAYGDDPVFVLTVGGFHPRFAPPALPFPAPSRISISLLATALARIRVEAYFAVSSNTAQFGAKAQLFFGLGPCEVSGQLSLDALFQFDPFYMVVEVSGSISLKVFGMGVFSIRLRFTLEGMTPWRARGEGSISFLFFDVSANFDITWGEAVAAVARVVAILPILRSEIAKVENWKQALPASLHLLVTLRPADSADVLVHPLGSLQFSQRAIPLDRQLDKVGEQRPLDAKRLGLRPKASTLRRLDDTREQFAPAQFEKLDAAAKLARRSYEPMVSGIELAPDGAQFATPKLVKRRVRYEEEIIDSNYKRSGARFGGRFAHLFNFFLNGSAVALSPLSAKRRSQLQPFEEKVELEAGRFVVAKRDDNSLYAANATFSSEAEALDHLKALGARERQALHVLPAWELAA